MDVEVFPVTGSPLKLTGDLPEEGVSDGELSYSRLQELINLVDAEAATTEDYGNESHEFRFSVSRVHETEGHAALYYLKHARSVPPKGHVKFTCLTATGELVGVATLNDAVIVAESADWTGHETTFTYTIRGGSIT